MAKQTCETCRFYLGASDLKDPSQSGICRRYPAQAVAYHQDEEYIETSVWPLVHGDDWCGEYRQ